MFYVEMDYHTDSDESAMSAGGDLPTKIESAHKLKGSGVPKLALPAAKVAVSQAASPPAKAGKATPAAPPPPKVPPFNLHKAATSDVKQGIAVPGASPTRVAVNTRSPSGVRGAKGPAIPTPVVTTAATGIKRLSITSSGSKSPVKSLQGGQSPIKRLSISSTGAPAAAKPLQGGLSNLKSAPDATTTADSRARLDSESRSRLDSAFSVDTDADFTGSPTRGRVVSTGDVFEAVILPPPAAETAQPTSNSTPYSASHATSPPHSGLMTSPKATSAAQKQRRCPHCSGDSGDVRQRNLHAKHGCPYNALTILKPKPDMLTGRTDASKSSLLSNASKKASNLGDPAEFSKRVRPPQLRVEFTPGVIPPPPTAKPRVKRDLLGRKPTIGGGSEAGDSPEMGGRKGGSGSESEASPVQSTASPPTQRTTDRSSSAVKERPEDGEQKTKAKRGLPMLNLGASSQGDLTALKSVRNYLMSPGGVGVLSPKPLVTPRLFPTPNELVYNAQVRGAIEPEFLNKMRDTNGDINLASGVSAWTNGLRTPAPTPRKIAGQQLPRSQSERVMQGPPLQSPSGRIRSSSMRSPQAAHSVMQGKGDKPRARPSAFTFELEEGTSPTGPGAHRTEALHTFSFAEVDEVASDSSAGSHKQKKSANNLSMQDMQATKIQNGAEERSPMPSTGKAGPVGVDLPLSPFTTKRSLSGAGAVQEDSSDSLHEIALRLNELEREVAGMSDDLPIESQTGPGGSARAARTRARVAKLMEADNLIRDAYIVKAQLPAENVRDANAEDLRKLYANLKEAARKAVDEAHAAFVEEKDEQAGKKPAVVPKASTFFDDSDEDEEDLDASSMLHMQDGGYLVALTGQNLRKRVISQSAVGGRARKALAPGESPLTNSRRLGAIKEFSDGREESDMSAAEILENANLPSLDQQVSHTLDVLEKLIKQFLSLPNNAPSRNVLNGSLNRSAASLAKLRTARQVIATMQPGSSSALWCSEDSMRVWPASGEYMAKQKQEPTSSLSPARAALLYSDKASQILTDMYQVEALFQQVALSILAESDTVLTSCNLKLGFVNQGVAQLAGLEEKDGSFSTDGDCHRVRELAQIVHDALNELTARLHPLEARAAAARDGHEANPSKIRLPEPDFTDLLEVLNRSRELQLAVNEAETLCKATLRSVRSVGPDKWDALESSRTADDPAYHVPPTTVADKVRVMVGSMKHQENELAVIHKLLNAIEKRVLETVQTKETAAVSRVQVRSLLSNWLLTVDNQASKKHDSVEETLHNAEAVIAEARAFYKLTVGALVGVSVSERSSAAGAAVEALSLADVDASIAASPHLADVRSAVKFLNMFEQMLAQSSTQVLSIRKETETLGVDVERLIDERAPVQQEKIGDVRLGEWDTRLGAVESEIEECAALIPTSSQNVKDALPDSMEQVLQQRKLLAIEGSFQLANTSKSLRGVISSDSVFVSPVTKLFCDTLSKAEKSVSATKLLLKSTSDVSPASSEDLTRLDDARQTLNMSRLLLDGIILPSDINASSRTILLFVMDKSEKQLQQAEDLLVRIAANGHPSTRDVAECRLTCSEAHRAVQQMKSAVEQVLQDHAKRIRLQKLTTQLSAARSRAEKAQASFDEFVTHLAQQAPTAESDVHKIQVAVESTEAAIRFLSALQEKAQAFCDRFAQATDKAHGEQGQDDDEGTARALADPETGIDAITDFILAVARLESSLETLHALRGELACQNEPAVTSPDATVDATHERVEPPSTRAGSSTIPKNAAARKKLKKSNKFALLSASLSALEQRKGSKSQVAAMMDPSRAVASKNGLLAAALGQEGHAAPSLLFRAIVGLPSIQRELQELQSTNTILVTDLNDAIARLKGVSAHYRRLLTAMREGNMSSVPADVGTILKDALINATRALRTADSMLPGADSRFRMVVTKTFVADFNDAVQRSSTAIFSFERAFRDAQYRVQQLLHTKSMSARSDAPDEYSDGSLSSDEYSEVSDRTDDSYTAEEEEQQVTIQMTATSTKEIAITQSGSAEFAMRRTHFLESGSIPGDRSGVSTPTSVAHGEHSSGITASKQTMKSAGDTVVSERGNGDSALAGGAHPTGQYEQLQLPQPASSPTQLLTPLVTTTKEPRIETGIEAGRGDGRGEQTEVWNGAKMRLQNTVLKASMSPSAARTRGPPRNTKALANVSLPTGITIEPTATAHGGEDALKDFDHSPSEREDSWSPPSERGRDWEEDGLDAFDGIDIFPDDSASSIGAFAARVHGIMDDFTSTRKPRFSVTYASPQKPRLNPIPQDKEEDEEDFSSDDDIADNDMMILKVPPSQQVAHPALATNQPNSARTDDSAGGPDDMMVLKLPNANANSGDPATARSSGSRGRTRDRFRGNVEMPEDDWSSGDEGIDDFRRIPKLSARSRQSDVTESMGSHAPDGYRAPPLSVRSAALPQGSRSAVPAAPLSVRSAAVPPPTRSAVPAPPLSVRSVSATRSVRQGVTSPTANVLMRTGTRANLNGWGTLDSRVTAGPDLATGLADGDPGTLDTERKRRTDRLKRLMSDDSIDSDVIDKKIERSAAPLSFPQSARPEHKLTGQATADRPKGEGTHSAALARLRGAVNAIRVTSKFQALHQDTPPLAPGTHDLDEAPRRAASAAFNAATLQPTPTAVGLRAVPSFVAAQGRSMTPHASFRVAPPSLPTSSAGPLSPRGGMPSGSWSLATAGASRPPAEPGSLTAARFALNDNEVRVTSRGAGVLAHQVAPGADLLKLPSPPGGATHTLNRNPTVANVMGTVSPGTASRTLAGGLKALQRQATAVNLLRKNIAQPASERRGRPITPPPNIKRGT